MIPENNFRVLKIIVERLSKEGVDWVLVGSTNLTLQGVDVEAKDIDILTSKEGAFKINRLFKEFEIKPVEYSELGIFKSYFGIFEIENIKVEVMANLEIKIPKHDIWTKKENISAKKIIEYKGIKIQAVSLEREYSTYSKMGRTDKANKIKELLDKS